MHQSTSAVLVTILTFWSVLVKIYITNGHLNFMGILEPFLQPYLKQGGNEEVSATWGFSWYCI